MPEDKVIQHIFSKSDLAYYVSDYSAAISMLHLTPPQSELHGWKENPVLELS